MSFALPEAAATVPRARRPRAATLLVILRILRHSPLLFACCVVCAVGTFGIPLLIGLVTRRYFDALTGGAAAASQIWTIIGLFVAVRVVEIFVDFGLVFSWCTLLFKSLALVRRNLLRLVLYGYGALGVLGSSGQALDRFRDDAEEVVEFIDRWTDLIGRGVFVTAAVFVMARIDARITLVVLVPLALVITLVNLLQSRIVAYRTASRAANGHATGFLGDLLGAVQVVKVAGATPHAVARLHGLNRVRRTTALRDRTFHELIWAFNYNIANVGTGVILLLAASSMRAGAFSVGDFALFVTYLGSMIWFPLEVADWITGYRQSGVSIERMQALVEAATLTRMPESELTMAAPLGQAGTIAHQERSAQPERESGARLDTLEATGLCYHHPGTGRGIEDVNLTLRRGSITVVTGRVGSGKSTLVEVLLGLLPREAGEVRWNGELVVHGCFRPPRSAYTPQTPRLFSATVRENVLLGEMAGADALAAAIHAAVLEQDLPGLEHGLDTTIGPRGVRLSGGQVQRVAAARMLVRAPELLVLDDISSALDVETERQLWERLTAVEGERSKVESRKSKVRIRTIRFGRSRRFGW